MITNSDRKLATAILLRDSDGAVAATVEFAAEVEKVAGIIAAHRDTHPDAEKLAYLKTLLGFATMAHPDKVAGYHLMQRGADETVHFFHPTWPRRRDPFANATLIDENYGKKGPFT